MKNPALVTVMVFTVALFGLMVGLATKGDAKNDTGFNPCSASAPLYSGIHPERLTTNANGTYRLYFSACMTAQVKSSELTHAYGNAKEAVYRADNADAIHSEEDVRKTAQDFLDQFPQPGAPHGVHVTYIVVVKK